MPLYEYQCEACSQRFERIQKFSDPPVDTCPSCGGSVRKLLSSPAIQFKGAGWYITDYARKGGGDKPASEKPAESSGEKEKKKEAASGGSTSAGEKAPTASKD